MDLIFQALMMANFDYGWKPVDYTEGDGWIVWSAGSGYQQTPEKNIWGWDGKYIPEMKFRYRELIYRPDFYDFDKEDCTEWMPNGIYNYNVSRMIRDLACHEEGSDTGI